MTKVDERESTTMGSQLGRRNIFKAFDPDISSDSDVDLELEDVPDSDSDSSDDVSDTDQPSTSTGEGKSRSRPRSSSASGSADTANRSITRLTEPLEPWAITTTPEMASFDSLPNKEDVDPEVASFIRMESQKAELQAQIHKLAEVCWDQCVDRPRDKLDSRAETCVSNCVERFIDTSLTIASRFQKLLQGASNNM